MVFVDPREDDKIEKNSGRDIVLERPVDGHGNVKIITITIKSFCLGGGRRAS